MIDNSMNTETAWMNGLGARARSCVIAMGVNSMEELAAKVPPAGHLVAVGDNVQGLGKKTLDEIARWLGLSEWGRHRGWMARPKDERKKGNWSNQYGSQ